jgi:hypothetical protein
VNETGWFPDGLPEDVELRAEALKSYIAQNLIGSRMNQLVGPGKSTEGVWYTALPDAYGARSKELGAGFAHKLFTRQIVLDKAEGGTHLAFSRMIQVGESYLTVRVLPNGDVQMRSPLKEFQAPQAGKTSLEQQWGLQHNVPGTKFLLEEILKHRRGNPLQRLFTKEKDYGSRDKLIDGTRDILASYLHDDEEAVVQLALPNLETRAAIIRSIRRDRQGWGDL